MDKEVIKDALNQASNMYPYEVIGEPDTYSLYNAGWQDAIDYVSQLSGWILTKPLFMLSSIAMC